LSSRSQGGKYKLAPYRPSARGLRLCINLPAPLDAAPGFGNLLRILVVPSNPFSAQELARALPIRPSGSPNTAQYHDP
jgi:hypothetical protein